MRDVLDAASVPALSEANRVGPLSGRLIAVDQTVAVGVEAVELVGGSEELARGDVAVAVPVHPREPDRQVRACDIRAWNGGRCGNRGEDTSSPGGRAASDAEPHSPRKLGEGDSSIE